MSVGWQLYGQAFIAGLFEPAFAFPISAESIEIPIPRNLDLQASITALLEPALTPPTER
jgi:hypothetical protein